jgi:hypothetical protein
MVKCRSILMVYLLSILTFGIYYLYWAVQTKEEMNSLGANVPTGWLLIIPIANLYWWYKYCDAFAKFVSKDNNGVLYFIIFIILPIIIPAIVQSGLNEIGCRN